MKIGGGGGYETLQGVSRDSQKKVTSSGRSGGGGMMDMYRANMSSFYAVFGEKMVK